MSPLLLAASLMATTQDTTWAALQRYVDSSVARRAFPGAVVAVGRHETVLFLQAFGRLDYEHGRRVTTRTVYDLASLTKVVGLTTAMMQLVAEGKVGLDTPAVRYVPAFHDSAVTVRQLLTHSSGLPAWKPFWPRVHSRAEMFTLVDAEPLEHPPGTAMVYSDLGAMVMTQIVEDVSGERLDRYLRIHLFRPLAMRDTRYLPPAGWRSRIAPTEVDTAYRHRLVVGEVHDENAASMGGISGHAGLFGTAPDLVKFAQLMLRTLRGESSSRRARTRRPRGTVELHPPGGLVDSATVAEFTRVQDPALSSRALGWDTPSEGSSAGTRLSPRAFGHTGFTGTSIWIDPVQDLFVILLTNRVHPTRSNELIREVRPRVADLAVAAAEAR
ncbi:MAG TPA: serine hydrolase domain-containing protein [Gemmatimonadales bacterium]|nr:serine hydrolase domain-containing protein [Gemmatimonadales bacterium]